MAEDDTSAKRRLRVLVTNDDGYDCPGILGLIQRLHALDAYDLLVAAPSRQQSGQSHSITLHSTLAAHRITIPDMESIVAWKIEGTPADCVKVAVSSNLFGDIVPDVVVSGINMGGNTGYNVHYSGTVGAAKEGTLYGIPSIALSLCSPPRGHTWLWDDASDAAARIVHRFITCDRLADFSHNVLNVNFPNVPTAQVKGWKLTRQGASQFEESYLEVDDMRTPNARVYRLVGKMRYSDKEDDLDGRVVEQGWISVSLLGLQLWDPQCAKKTDYLSTWDDLFG